MSDQIERRDFIQRVGILTGVAAAATGLVATPAFPQTGAKPMTYEPKPLSLDPKAIKGISEKILVSHYDNNYVGAVKRLNANPASRCRETRSLEPWRNRDQRAGHRSRFGKANCNSQRTKV